LPTDVRQAAELLGFTRSIWNKEGNVPNEEKQWSELTEAEQNAATILGYSEDTWNDDSSSSSSDESSPTRHKTKMQVIPEEKEGKYDEYDFQDLPAEVKRAAKILGYTHSIWDKDESIPIEEKEWSNLTEAEQKAATIIGYTKNKWDSDSDSDSEMPVIPEEEKENYDKYDFQDLPAEVKRAAKILGYTRSIWDKDESIPIEEKEWSDLTEAEQKASTIIGYTKKKWDNDSNSDSEMPVIPVEEKENYDKHDFQDLPAEVMQAAKILGYTRSIWDKGKSIPNEEKDWSELTETEQNAAVTLGYTQKEWDDESDSKSSPSDGSSPWDESAQSQLQATSKSSTRPPSFKLSFTKYGEYDFDELPPNIQQAALVLGFEQEIWDRDTLIRGRIKHWDYLTSKEKEACKALGCTQTTWEKWYQGLYSTEILPNFTGSNVGQVLCCAGIETDFF
jgi:hypothetical protein